MTEDGGRMKSAYELAMERLEKKDGKLKPLTEAQKKAIADIDSQVKAKIAEVEIMSKRDLADARARGDADKIQSIEAERTRAIERARSRGEEDKNRVRNGETDS